MARKRGGLAGLWDSKKGVIKTLAPIALGAIPGVGVPLAAAAGAAMGGLDREGKSGIGLDLGGAVKGGVTGYLGGQTGKAIAGGVKGLLTGAGKGVGAAAGAAPSTTPSASVDALLRSGGGFMGSPVSTAGGAAKAGASMLSRAGTFAKENKDLLTLAGKGIMATMPDAASDAAMMNAETTRMRLEEERRQAQMEEERRRRLAELLMPMARQTFPGYFGNT